MPFFGGKTLKIAPNIDIKHVKQQSVLGMLNFWFSCICNLIFF